MTRKQPETLDNLKVLLVLRSKYDKDNNACFWRKLSCGHLTWRLDGVALASRRLSFNDLRLCETGRRHGTYEVDTATRVSRQHSVHYNVLKMVQREN